MNTHLLTGKAQRRALSGMAIAPVAAGVGMAGAPSASAGPAPTNIEDFYITVLKGIPELQSKGYHFDTPEQRQLSLQIG